MLTKEQVQAIIEFAPGHTMREIADKLHLPFNAVRYYAKKFNLPIIQKCYDKEIDSFKCNPPKSCFDCPYSDCRRKSFTMTDEEKEWR